MNIPLNIDWQQILLHLFNFALLFAILYYLLYKPVKDFMKKRELYYKEMDEKAKDGLTEADKLKAEYENKLKSAEEEVSAIKLKAGEATESTRKEILDKAEKEADKIVAEARKRAKDEHDRMLDEARSEITEIISMAAEKVVAGENVSDSFDSFLDNAEKNDK